MKIFLKSLLLFCLVCLPAWEAKSAPCNWSTNQDSTIVHNCDSLTVTGTVTFTGTSNVTINVTGDVNIDGHLNVNGPAGSAGTGGAGIAGGKDGGDSANPGIIVVANSNGLAGGAPTDGGNFTELGGGGGSGAAHGKLGLAGENGGGTPVGGDIVGQGAAAPTATYDSTLNFPTMNGGSGGGGGGQGLDTGGLPSQTGGAGGAGGGAIYINAGGDITISGTLSANGGAGETTTNGTEGPGGAGGGGAGGAIYLKTPSNIYVTGTISVAGGGGGIGGTSLNSVKGGNGGSGGEGLARLDADYLQVSSGASIPTSATINAKTNLPVTEFASDISPGCAIRERQDYSPLFFVLLILGFIGINLQIQKRQKV